MRKLLSVLFAILILVSGLHLTVATHFCCGKVAAVKWSFTGQYASCGMEECNNTRTHIVIVPADCCQNQISFFSVDNSYSPSSSQSGEFVKASIPFAACPLNPFINLSSTNFVAFTDISPPDEKNASRVRLADICVFRI